jgi:hypothetical protein
VWIEYHVTEQIIIPKSGYLGSSWRYQFSDCAIGWVDIGTRAKVPPEVCYIPFKSNGNKRPRHRWSTFFRCILPLRIVYVFEIYIKFCVFWYPWSPYCEYKNLDPYIVHDPKCCEQWWSGHWVKQIFFAIFGTFGRYVTNLRGTFAENVKIVQNPPYCARTAIVRAS